jgi:hypothetical protein
MRITHLGWVRIHQGVQPTVIRLPEEFDIVTRINSTIASITDKNWTFCFFCEKLVLFAIDGVYGNSSIQEGLMGYPVNPSLMDLELVVALVVLNPFVTIGLSQ